MTQTPAQHRRSMRKYNAKPENKKIRAARNAARRLLEKEGLVKKGDGKDVDHKDGNPLNNSRKNLRVQHKRRNRRRNEHGGHG